jgi:hypothetical protein
MGFLHISKCTQADIKCYGLVLSNVAVLHNGKCTEADIKCNGLVLWNVRFYTLVTVL